MPDEETTNVPITDSVEPQQAEEVQVDPRVHELLPILNLIVPEVLQAMSSFPPFHSLHEGYAILQEEVEELWDEIKLNPKKRSRERVRQEAVQVAAMAIRLVHDAKLLDPNHRDIQ